MPKLVLTENQILGMRKFEFSPLYLITKIMCQTKEGENLLREEFERKEHTVTENVLVDQYLFCDVCGKEIKNGEDYYELVTGHNDWGNDSCDSIETSDICSYECLNVRLRSYVDSSFGRNPNTEYFNVAHKTFFKRVKE